MTSALKLFSAIVFLISQAGVATAQTWICDARASAGFDREMNYEVIRFRAGRSYRIRSGIQPQELTWEFERNNRIFQFQNDTLIAASIQEVGHSFTSLCRHTISDGGGVASLAFEWIQCDNPRIGDSFRFNVHTGLFTLLSHGFESEHGGQSWIEVGECRRIR
jgi:hypothetical protein